MNGIFPVTSRYHGIEVSEIELADGRRVSYLRRRFLPPADRFAVLSTHAVVDGDRLDNLAATHLGDPEQFWRICDANGAMLPDELTAAVGRLLRITLPEGVSGPVA